MSRTTAFALGALMVILVAACSSDADVASQNLSKAAEQFEISRRITFLNGITDSAPLIIEGRCSIENEGAHLTVTCKDNNDQFMKHYLGLSDNMSYVVEQLTAADASTSQYRFFVRPSALIPNIDVE
jgi:hypothetical protein